jgi:tRNA(Met) cytidine acetyltransferase
MELAARLREEAARSDQRRVLVLAGAPERTRTRASDALAAAAIPPGETTYVGPGEGFRHETLGYSEADRLLGTSRTAVVYDCHGRCEPNTLGKLVGTVAAGGLLVVLVPPLSEWPARRDGFDRSLAVPPFEAAEVGTNFRERLIGTLRSHRGIAVVDVDAGTVEREGLFDPPPRIDRESVTPPPDRRFPRAAYEVCRTGDQAEAVAALEALADPGEAVVVEANRGRGKSSAAGIAAACLALDGSDVLVTAPGPGSAAALFERARETLDRIDGEPQGEHATDGVDTVTTPTGQIRYEEPTDATTLPGAPDVVIVDEAAALPVRVLRGFLDADSAAFVTTIHGYEGTGRGFSVRFRDHLDGSDLRVTPVSLSAPIRYGPADPVEVWSFRALALDARPPVDQLVSDATPESVTYRELTGEELRGDERLLSEVFGLLVLAHYRTEPNDLARLLDAPNVSVRCLTHEGHVVAVALLAREGGLPPQRRRAVSGGERIRGHLLPDVLMSQLRDEAAGEPTGLRVMRIATHAAVRSRGLGSVLLDRIRERARRADIDYLGVAYGVTPELARFWADNGFSTVHLSTTRNARSGEHSAVMLDPLTDAGRELLDRHTDWFLRRTPAAVRESLADADPAVIRAACAAADGVPELELSEVEWRHAAGMATGSAIFETAPRGPQRLCFRHLVAPAKRCLTPSQRRLLIRKGVQGQSWAAIAAAEDYHGESACKREMGTVVGELVDLYGGPTARTVLDNGGSD